VALISLLNKPANVPSPASVHALRPFGVSLTSLQQARHDWPCIQGIVNEHAAPRRRERPDLFPQLIDVEGLQASLSAQFAPSTSKAVRRDSRVWSAEMSPSSGPPAAIASTSREVPGMSGRARVQCPCGQPGTG